MKVGAVGDLDIPASRSSARLGHFRPLVSGIVEYSLNERKAPSHIAQELALNKFLDCTKARAERPTSKNPHSGLVTS